jgi:transposase
MSNPVNAAAGMVPTAGHPRRASARPVRGQGQRGPRWERQVWPQHWRPHVLKGNSEGPKAQLPVPDYQTASRGRRTHDIGGQPQPILSPERAPRKGIQDYLVVTAVAGLVGTVYGMSCSGDLTEQQWAPLEPAFNAPGKRGPKHAPDLRRAVDAMLYVCHTGCQWRYPPGSLGPWTRVWSQFGRWSRNRTWARALTVLHATAREAGDRADARRRWWSSTPTSPAGASNGEARPGFSVREEAASYWHAPSPGCSVARRRLAGWDEPRDRVGFRPASSSATFLKASSSSRGRPGEDHPG